MAGPGQGDLECHGDWVGPGIEGGFSVCPLY